MAITHYSINANIAAGASVSDAWQVDAGNTVPALIVMPAAWDAADIGFQASVDGVTYQPLYDQYGNPYTVKVAGGRSVALNPFDLAGFAWVKLVSVTAGTVTGVNQTSARVVTIVVRGY